MEIASSSTPGLVRNFVAALRPVCVAAVCLVGAVGSIGCADCGGTGSAGSGGSGSSGSTTASAGGGGAGASGGSGGSSVGGMGGSGGSGGVGGSGGRGGMGGGTGGSGGGVADCALAIAATPGRAGIDCTNDMVSVYDPTHLCVGEWSGAYVADPVYYTCTEICSSVGLGCVAARDADVGYCQQDESPGLLSCDTPPSGLATSSSTIDIGCLCHNEHRLPAAPTSPTARRPPTRLPRRRGRAPMTPAAASSGPTAELPTTCLLQFHSKVYQKPGYGTCAQLCAAGGMGCIVSRGVDNPTCDPVSAVDHACDATVPFGDVMCFCFRGQP